MKSMLVADFMSAVVLTLRPEMRVLDAVHMLVANRISGAPVVDRRSSIVGILSERDCLRLALESGYHGGDAGPVSDFMSTEVETVEPELSLVAMAQRFADHPYRRYPVVKDNRLVGIISRRDVLRGLLSSR